MVIPTYLISTITLLRTYVPFYSDFIIFNLNKTAKKKGGRPTTIISRPSLFLLIFSSEPPQNPRVLSILFFSSDLIFILYHEGPPLGRQKRLKFFLNKVWHHSHGFEIPTWSNILCPNVARFLKNNCFFENWNF